MNNIKHLVWLVVVSISITMFGNVINATESTTPSGIPVETLEGYVDDFAQEHIGIETAGAAIAIIEDNNILLRKNYGYADIANGIEIDDDTVFEWGSTSKILVYISIMQLVEEGKLSLDTDIRAYLPDGFLKNLQYDEKITLLNLMHHNAGWSDNIRDMMFDDFASIGSLEDQMRIFEPKQVFHVGEGSGYSNFGIGLAGYIVEQVSGQPYYEYVEEHIFDVLNMEDTNVNYGASRNQDVEARRSKIKGYGAGLEEKERLYVAVYPAGSVIGTLDDMVKLVMAINPRSSSNPLFENESTLDLFLEQSYSAQEGLPGYAHGLFEEIYAQRTVGHAGHTNAFSAEIAFSPESGFGYVVLSNQDHEEAMSVQLEGLLFGKEVLEVYDGTMPNAESVVGFYMNYRNMFAGFERWLAFADEVVLVNDQQIQYKGEIATQVSPYRFMYTDEKGIQQLISFEVMDGQVKKMIVESHSESFLVNGFQARLNYIVLILFAICALYFIFTLIILLVRLIRTGVPSEAKLRYRFVIVLFGAISILNTVKMYMMVISFTSQKALMPHLAFNVLYLAIVFGLLLASRMKKEKLSKRNLISLRVSYVFSVLWCLMIALCHFYR